MEWHISSTFNSRSSITQLSDRQFLLIFYIFFKKLSGGRRAAIFVGPLLGDACVDCYLITLRYLWQNKIKLTRITKLRPELSYDEALLCYSINESSRTHLQKRECFFFLSCGHSRTVGTIKQNNKQLVFMTYLSRPICFYA